jgi:hypothetical protein
MKVGFGATQVRRLLPAVEINNRTGADRPVAEVRGSNSRVSKRTTDREAR